MPRADNATVANSAFFQGALSVRANGRIGANCIAIANQQNFLIANLDA
jgi:hypothetical protein